MKIVNRVWGHMSAKRGVVASIFIILILTVLEFPKRFGLGTRSQGNVSRPWFVFFFVILFCEIVALIWIHRHAKMAARLAIVAAVLNIFQIVAYHTHMVRPQLASRSYSLLEYAVGFVSLALIYFSLGVLGYLRKI